MKFSPHGYQQRAIDFVKRNKRCALHIDMGLGKTASVLSACVDLFESLDVRSAVVFAPLRVATIAWPGELEKWGEFNHLNTTIIRGQSPESCWQLREPADLYLINYDIMQWWVDWVKAEVKRRKVPFDMLVLDESSRLKSSASARFKCLKPLADSQLFTRIVEMTGTPSPESYEDLWSQYRLLDGGERLGKFVTHFRSRYFIQNPYNEYDWKLRPGSDVAIQAAISDITFTARADDYLSLPPIIENDIYVDLPAEAQRQYKGIEEDMLTLIADETVAAPSAAMVSEKCRQLVAGAIYRKDGSTLPVHTIKFDALDELIEASTTALLVAYWYKHEFETIRKRYIGAPVLGPGLSDAEAKRIVKDWNAGKIKVLFMHPASVGHGVNLQEGGSDLVWLTIPWSNEIYQQSIGRLHRMGQGRPVIVHRILMRKTIDIVVDSAVKKKEFSQNDLRVALAAMQKG